MDQEHGERKQTVRYQAFWLKLYPYPGKQYYGKRRVKKIKKKKNKFCLCREGFRWQGKTIKAKI